MNLFNVKANMELALPQITNKVSILVKKVVVLSQFLSRLVDISNPFFWVLRKGKSFERRDECQQGFEELKQLLENYVLLYSR